MNTRIPESTVLWSEIQQLVDTSPQGGWEEFDQAHEEFKSKGLRLSIYPTTNQDYSFDYTEDTNPPSSYAYSDLSATPLTPTTTNSTFGASTPNYQSSVDSDSNTMESASPNSEKKATHQCTFCNKVFEKRHLLNRHINTHTKPISCPQCPHTTAKRRDMERHIIAKHPASEQGSTLARASRFPCTVGTCKYSQARSAFKRKDHLVRHMRNKH